ncbi:MAG: DUF6502 family protein [Myxococcota bacterium]
MSRTEGPPQTQVPPALARAVSYLLRPLVRLLMDHGVTYPTFAGWLKQVYFDVAREDSERRGEAANASRWSVRTGLHRKDLKRLQEASVAGPLVAPPAVSLGARVLAQWTGDARFCDAEGQPLALARSDDPAAATDGSPSFETLVESVSTDVRPRAVLDAWLELGLVEEDDEGRLRLVSDAFVPRRGFDEKAHYFGRNLHDHLAAAAGNLAGDPPRLERSVHYGSLRASSVRELRELAESDGMDTLRRLNRRARALQERDADAPDAAHRINVGLYVYDASQGDPEPES